MAKKGTKTGRTITGTNSPNDRPKQKKRPDNPAADLCRLVTKTGNNSLRNMKKTDVAVTTAEEVGPLIGGTPVFKQLGMLQGDVGHTEVSEYQSGDSSGDRSND